MNLVRISTGIVRLNFVHISEPHAFKEGDTPKYMVTVMLEKDDFRAINPIREAIGKAMEEGKTSLWNNKIPAKVWNPLRDGSEKADDYPEFEDMMFFNAKSSYPPGVIDENKVAIMPSDLKSRVYSGCYAKVCVSFGPYKNKEGGSGVTCFLNSIMFMQDGESLEREGKADPAKDFEDTATIANYV